MSSKEWFRGDDFHNKRIIQNSLDRHSTQRPNYDKKKKVLGLSESSYTTAICII